MKAERRGRWLWLWLLCLCACGPGIETKNQPVLTTNAPENTLVFGGWSEQAQQRSILVSAKGGEATITGIKLLGDPGFSLVAMPSLPLLIPTTTPLHLEVRANTAELATRDGRLRINCPGCKNVNDEGYFYINIRQVAGEAKPTWRCGGTLAFGAVNVGETSTKRCQLTNPGNADLVVEGVRFVPEQRKKSGFAWKGPKFPLVLKAGDVTGIDAEVTFAPTAETSAKDSGRFVLQTKGPMALPTPEVSLQVTGSIVQTSRIVLVPVYPTCQNNADCSKFDPRLSCLDDAFSKTKRCGRENAGDGTLPLLKFPLTLKSEAVTRTVLIRNLGNAHAQIDAITIEGVESQDFKLQLGKQTFPLHLAPNEEKQVSVVYAPSDDRKDSGTLVVSSDSLETANASMLLEAAENGCRLKITPHKLAFYGSISKQVTISNVGNALCIISKVSILADHSNYALLPAPKPNTQLGPGQHLSFLVKFSYSQPQSSYRGSIVITSNDLAKPILTISLEVYGNEQTPCELEASPTTVNYGLVPAGRSRKSSVTIRNKGYGDCKVTSLKMLGTNPAGHKAFQLTSTIKTPFKIAAGSNIRLDVLYTPPAERSGYESNLEIVSNDVRNPIFSVKLVGSSGLLCLEVLPSNLNFGSAKFGCATTERTVTVYNPGHPKCGKSISVTGITLAQNPTSEFRINSAPATPLTLNAGDCLKIKMAYKPKDLGVDTATLEIGNSVAGQSPIPVPLVGEGVSTAEQKDVFKQFTRPIVDIAFIIDNSSAMASVQATLASNMQAFINWAIRLNIDYQIMVTTTDTTGKPQPAGCAHGTTPIITPQTPEPVKAFLQNTLVGTKGSSQTHGLEAAYQMLTPPATLKCNKGFYRKDGLLSLIFVSNGVDKSPKPTKFYIDFLQQLKGQRNLDLLRASVIVGPSPQGCTGTKTGAAQAAPRYWDVAKQLKGTQQSICNENWLFSPSLGISTFGYRSQFTLSRPADPKTLQVKINGIPTKQNAQDGWVYDATSNSVIFAKSNQPAPGSTISIEYKAVCLP